MEKLIIIILILLLIVAVIFCRIGIQLANNVEKLEICKTTLCKVQRDLDYIGRHFEDICEQHEEDVRKIQAEVLAADILKDKEG